MPHQLEPLIKDYVLLLKIRGYAERTQHEYVRLLRLMFPDGVFPDAFTRHDVLVLLDAVDTDSKRRWRWLALRSFCRFLVEEEILDREPTEKIPMPKEEEKKQPILSDETLEAMLQTCSSKRFNDVRDRALLLTMASTGCRRVELCDMRISDLNMTTGSVKIHSAKGGPERTSYLDPDSRRALLRYLRGARSDEALWTTAGGRPLTVNAVSQMIERRARAAGLKATPHQFRRRLAAAWLLNGGSEVGLMETAGWKSSAMPKRYVASAAEEIARADHERIAGKRLQFRKKKARSR